MSGTQYERHSRRQSPLPHHWRNDGDGDDRRRSTRKDEKSKSKHRRHDASKSPPPQRVHASVEISELAERLTGVSTYVDVANPFNDDNLNAKFVWSKKRERDRKLGRSHSDRGRLRMETETELERLRLQRDQREQEREERGREKIRVQQEQESALLGDWRTKEQAFHLEQARRRAEIRVRDGRARPIDLLAMQIRLAVDPSIRRAKRLLIDEDEEREMDDLDVDLAEPYAIFDGMPLRDVEGLYDDIRLYLELEAEEENLEFWRAMLLVCDDRLADLRDQAEMEAYALSSRGSVSARPPLTVGMLARTRSLPAPVQNDVNLLLSTKSLEELRHLHRQVDEKLGVGGPGVDIDYWERILRGVIVWKARAKLKMMYAQLVNRRIVRLRVRQRQDAELAVRELLHRPRKESVEPRRPMSPARLAAPTARDAGLPVVKDPAAELQQVTLNRERIRRRKFVPKHNVATIQTRVDNLVRVEKETAQEAKTERLAKAAFRRIENEEAFEWFVNDEDVSEDEEAFEEQAVEPFSESGGERRYDWQDKYHPRKPRYVNSVRTGYEWNKYNQTHYDHDNPPPKVVQGYKFNIFYPDLIDRTRAPTYKIEREAGTSDTVLLRFVAGPPYEDVAFRIVSREWEYSHRFGFKCKFDRGVLQLHFRFRRQTYRR